MNCLFLSRSPYFQLSRSCVYFLTTSSTKLVALKVGFLCFYFRSLYYSATTRTFPPLPECSLAISRYAETSRGLPTTFVQAHHLGMLQGSFLMGTNRQVGVSSFLFCILVYFKLLGSYRFRKILGFNKLNLCTFQTGISVQLIFESVYFSTSSLSFLFR